MADVTLTLEEFLQDSQGRTFTDVAEDPELPFAEILEFFSDTARQRRMEESEIHHDRSPLAGVVRELEAHPTVHRFLSDVHERRSKRLRQATGVVVRIIMERRGWMKTGRKGSLGVRAPRSKSPTPRHNTGGLAFWFIRGERYKRQEGMPFQSVRERCADLNAESSEQSSVGLRHDGPTRRRRTRNSPATKKTQTAQDESGGAS